MTLLSHIQNLEGKSTRDRFAWITQFLDRHHISYTLQPYSSGENILVKPRSRKPLVAISSHFDVVSRSPGANDNASAISVCLSILQQLQQHTFTHFDVAVFFFDEEEVGLRGSKAYVHQFGIRELRALFNLEMVGQGNQFALWSLNNTSVNKAADTFTTIAKSLQIDTHRFDQIVTNAADHQSFRKAGLQTAFSITCISDKDIEVANHYYKAQEFDVDKDTLREILAEAPLFRHYHATSDLSVHLSEESLQMTAKTLWNTLKELDN